MDENILIDNEDDSEDDNESSDIDPSASSRENYDDATPVSFITGPAGTGKTYRIRERVKDDPTYAITACTTGIAAVNLNTNTINSILGYFNTESLKEAYVSGKLTSRLRALRQRYRNLAIDEVSMMDADQLDLIYKATNDVNSDWDGRPLGIVLTGDFAQLPPVKGKWAFQAESWKYFAQNIERLTKIWRQDDPRFLEALQHARSGNGAEASEILGQISKFAVSLDEKFDGTTIFDKNDKVDRFNWVRFQELMTPMFSMPSRRWGQERSEWKLIPEALALKPGALVMILVNAQTIPGLPSEYANGDLAYVEKFDSGFVVVRLKRNDAQVWVPYITRNTETKQKPADLNDVQLYGEARGETPENLPPELVWEKVYYNRFTKKYVVGAIKYVPLRLAYAATVHKTQGLTLDSVQIDPRGHFFGSPNMAYVALSRVKTPAGLRVVGTPLMLKGRIKIAPEVKDWV